MSHKSKVKLLNITVLNFLSRIVFYLFVFGVGFVASRKFSSHVFGEVQFVSFLVSQGWVLFNFGIPGILGRFLPQAVQNAHNKDVGFLIKVAAYTILVSSLCNLLFVWVTYQVVIFHIPMVHICVWAASNTLVSFSSVLVQSAYKYTAILWINITACLFGSLFLLFTINHTGQLAYIYTFSIVNLVMFTGHLFVLRFSLLPIFSVKPAGSGSVIPEKRKLLKMAIYLAGSALLAGILWQRFELSLLKHFFNYNQLAYYGVAFTVVSLFVEPMKLIPGSLLYYYSGIRDDYERASAKFTDFFRHFFWFVIFWGGFLYFNVEPVVTLLYTDKYVHSVPYVRLLLMGLIPGVCGYVFMNMHTGLGKARFLFIQDLTGVVLFITLLLILVPFWGLAGAAISKSVVIAVSVTMGVFYTVKHLNYQMPWIPVLLSTLVSFILLYITQHVLKDSLLSLFFKALILFVVYTFISYVLNIINRSLIKSNLQNLRKYVLK